MRIAVNNMKTFALPLALALWFCLPGLAAAQSICSSTPAPANTTLIQASCVETQDSCSSVAKSQGPNVTFSVVSADCPTSAPICCVLTSQNAVNSTASTAGGAGSSMVLNDPLHGMTIDEIIGNFVSIFLGFTGAIALLVFVYAGIMYMTAGSSDRVKTAMDTMKYAVLGLAVIMFAYILTTFYFKVLTSDVTAPAATKNVATPKS